LGGAMTAAGALRAQQKAMPTIGILGLGYPDDPAIALNLTAFRRGLNETGFVEGRQRRRHRFGDRGEKHDRSNPDRFP
jgi:hypothetical protein